MELQDAWVNLERTGVAVFGLSYDSVETLAAFADKRGITYPLLSDEGSHTIRALGLLNEEHLVEQHAFYGIATRDEQKGVAYPGTFVLDEQGIVSEKRFEQSYRVRPTAGLFEEYALGSSQDLPSVVATKPGDGLTVRAWTDSSTYRPYQQVRLHVELALERGMHVYAPPVPDGYTALLLQVEPLEGLGVGQPEMPRPRPFTVEGLDERFFVYDGTIRAMIPLGFTKNLGATVVAVQIAYQTCTPTTCFPPAALRVDVPLNGLDLIRD